IRTTFSPRELEVRLDANGSFNTVNALERLKRLSDYGIHSIEQPVPAGLLDAMSELCRESPIDIALDEELIGLTPDSCKLHILRDVRPRYIILKPTLCGGIREALKWQSLAEGDGVGWWMTSALESSIGLYYLAAHVSSLKPSMPQGLGTGKIYTNNIGSGMSLSSGMLYGGAPNFDFEFLNTLEWQ
ncbi:MAG: o-succinylbenzoate synthase, partial [Muribaculaceae bacterium]|nr:o-succinylbenzoate synthase [Muribaculaceae bacterium]